MKKAIYGFGGHAREVAAHMGCAVEFFVDDIYSNDIAKPISQFDPDIYQLMIAVGDSKTRLDIVQKLPKNTKYFTFIHPTAILLDDTIEIGEGSFIGAYSILTTNIKIGKHAILNRANHIGHDCIIGDYFSAMPGAIVSGNCVIYDCVYIGTNASVKEKITIHSLSTIGINSCVIKNIETSGTYVGTPVKQIK
jgi:sugar O-acyltransferase (sialic acid O-acetyltransferase NeuD family)